MSLLKYNTVLFDLDGTLTDSGEGIMNSVAYALESYGIKVENKDDLRCFVGPPLYDSFEKHYGFSKDEAVKAVAKYREYFATKGIFENKIFPKTRWLLEELKKSGCRLVIATSKPEVYALKILEYFDIKKYFDVVVGPLLSGELIKKEDVIKECLKRLGNETSENCIMIGDREHDIKGAKFNDMASIGVLFGYGDREELEGAKADYIVNDFSEILAIIKGE